MRFFELAEEELYCSLGQSWPDVYYSLGVGFPRVELWCRYRKPPAPMSGCFANSGDAAGRRAGTGGRSQLPGCLREAPGISRRSAAPAAAGRAAGLPPSPYAACGCIAVRSLTAVNLPGGWTDRFLRPDISR